MQEHKSEDKSSGFAFYALISLMGLSFLLILGYLVYSLF